MNIFLIGYRCTGKTSLGKILANRLEWPFVDTDRMIVEANGASIARLVETQGWAFFREQEYKTLQGVCEKKNQVVATGGGMILDGRNVIAMQNTGRVIWLTASREVIAARMLADDTTMDSRPALTDQGLLGEIETILAQRNSLYERAAELIINTDRMTIAAICDQINAQLFIQGHTDSKKKPFSHQ